jgi:hypothetical protein
MRATGLLLPPEAASTKGSDMLLADMLAARRSWTADDEGV